MNYWLVKTEPEVFSIDDLKRVRKTQWDNVRNYQARNFLREMEVGDLVLIYHSNVEPSGIAGIAAVARAAYPDPSQFDSKSDYFDPKATTDAPRWFAPDLKFQQKFMELVPIAELRKHKALANMTLLQRGSRLSVHKLTQSQFNTVLSLSRE